MALPEIDYCEYSSDTLAQAAYASNGLLTPDASLNDGGMETWSSATVLTYWSKFGGYGQLDRESTTKKVGSYSAKLTRLDSNGEIQVQDIQNNNGHNIAYWKGKTITVGGWSKVNVTNSGLTIYDGVALNGANNTGDNNWQFLTFTTVVSASATALQFWIIVSGAAGAIAYYDGVCFVQGNAIYDGVNGLATIQSFSESTIKTQGSYSLKGMACITDSLNKTLTRTVSPTIDLSNIANLSFDIRSTRTGSNIKIGIHDSGGTTTEITPNITSANTFQTVSWDISAVSNVNKDAIDSIIITIVNADAANTFYFDNFIASPLPPTSVSATKNQNDKVTVTWTKSIGATGYRVYQNGVDVSGLLGDVATFDDTSAAAPVITSGTISASDGTSTSSVTLVSKTSPSIANGTTYTYTVKAVGVGGISGASASDTGYRLAATITYQWQRSSGDYDADYSNLTGATTSGWNDTTAPTNGSGRYYKLAYSATGLTITYSSADRGNLYLASWAIGKTITSVHRGTHLVSFRVPPGTYMFYICAIDKSGNYSNTPTTYPLTVTNSNFPVITAVDQAAIGWPGTCVNFGRHCSGALYPTSQGTADQDGDYTFNLLCPQPYATYTYTAPEQALSDNFSVRALATLVSTLGWGEIGIPDPRLQIKYKVSGGAYNNYADWDIGTITAQAVTMQIVMTAAVGVAWVGSFIPTLDKPIRSEQGVNVGVVTGGTTITFTTPFISQPAVQVTLLSAGSFSISQTTTGFTITGFTGNINWTATGG